MDEDDQKPVTVENHDFKMSIIQQENCHYISPQKNRENIDKNYITSFINEISAINNSTQYDTSMNLTQIELIRKL